MDEKLRDMLVEILIVVLIFLTFVFSIVSFNKSQPKVLKDYGNFAIVEVNGERYIWNKDIYGEGMYHLEDK